MRAARVRILCRCVGRLKPGVTRAQAQADMDVIGETD